MSIPRLLQIMREQGSSGNSLNTFIGEVSSSSPLKIKTGEIELDSEQLRKLSTESFQVKDEVVLIQLSPYFVILGKVREV